MGDRYFITVKCEKCGTETEDVYYAPTCGITDFKCVCGNTIDLEQYTGISYEDASNADLIGKIVDEIAKGGAA